ncbi:hypothetical protein FRC02_003627 [Tulasnella sp. 418]|nr:hypothetical protein FRC02_003627 [Tulasnella sp. 418]
MRLTGLLSAALYIGSGLSSSPFDIPPGRLHPRQATGVAWKPCFRENTECVGLAVPLDYANPSAGSARLAVIRYKATATPRLGTLFLNPGGPGGSGVQLVELSGRTFSNLTGGHYDIVGWDPRGINNSLPLIDCFASPIAESQMLTRIQNIQVEAGRNFSALDAQNLYAQQSYVDQTISSVYESCFTTQGDNLKYVGTVCLQGCWHRGK